MSFAPIASPVPGTKQTLCALLTIQWLGGNWSCLAVSEEPLQKLAFTNSTRGLARLPLSKLRLAFGGRFLFWERL